MNCERCGIDESRAEVQFSAATQQKLCEHCLLAPDSAPPKRAVPRPLSLVPCATAGEEPEVEQLLQLNREGRFEPMTVDMPDLPADATPAMHAVADFFKLVRGLRLAAGDDRDVPFAVRWVGGKLGLPHRTVARALDQLRVAGVLRVAGTMPGRGGRGTALWAPCDVPQASVLPFESRASA